MTALSARRLAVLSLVVAAFLLTGCDQIPWRRTVTHPIDTKVTAHEVLHRLALDGAVLSHFAIPYRHAGFGGRMAMSEGLITCAPAAGVVVVGFRHRAAIEAYNVAEGTLAWHARVAGLMLPEVRESSGGWRITTGIFDRNRLHVLLQVAGGDEVPVILQYRAMSRAEYLARAGGGRIETYVVDPATTAGGFWTDSIGEIVRLTSNRVVFKGADPWPHIIVAAF